MTREPTKTARVTAKLTGLAVNGTQAALAVLSLMYGGTWSTALAWLTIGIVGFVYLIRELTR